MKSYFEAFNFERFDFFIKVIQEADSVYLKEVLK